MALSGWCVFDPVFWFSGEVKRSCIPTAVPLWSFLCLHPTQGTGVQKYCVDR